MSGAKRARSTLQWLASHGYEELARNAIVVITDIDEMSSRVEKDALEEHLAGMCHELITVPHDRGGRRGPGDPGCAEAGTRRVTRRLPRRLRTGNGRTGEGERLGRFPNAGQYDMGSD